MCFMGMVRDDPERIISMTKMLKDNLDRGHAPAPTPDQAPFRKIMDSTIEKILSHEKDVKKSGGIIIDLYDDLLDEMINAGLGGFM